MKMLTNLTVRKMATMAFCLMLPFGVSAQSTASLQNAVKTAETFFSTAVLTDYMPGAVENYRDALLAAKACLAQTSVTQTVINARTTALTTARTTLNSSKGKSYDVEALPEGYDAERGFRHPGGLHTKADFDRIKQQLKEEHQKRTEAELEWLKNQLNPHFLFNTLNNISSLVQIDADKAQDAIAQLSDLMRYAMYETRREMVPIQGEVEFMRNYIELMKLRCNDKTEVNVQWSMVNGQLEVAPLLFISLIENAFKHGVSSSRPSKIDIRLEQQDDSLVFTCDNTNFPKDDTDRSGSGIGLENTRRRLDLLYGGHYTWDQSVNGDIYHVRITLKNEE